MLINPNPNPNPNTLHPKCHWHQGVFVLRDAKFRWLLPFTADDEVREGQNILDSS